MYIAVQLILRHSQSSQKFTWDTFQKILVWWHYGKYDYHTSFLKTCLRSCWFCKTHFFEQLWNKKLPNLTCILNSRMGNFFHFKNYSFSINFIVSMHNAQNLNHDGKEFKIRTWNLAFIVFLFFYLVEMQSNNVRTISINVNGKMSNSGKFRCRLRKEQGIKW